MTSGPRGRFVPGLTGIVQQAAHGGLRARFEESVLGSTPAASAVEAVSDPAGHWIVAHADWSRASGRWHHGTSGVRVAVHGVLHHDLVGGKGQPGGGTDPAAVIERFYAEAGVRVGSLIDGAFCALIVDAPRNRVLLINDVIGTFPLYWTVRDRRLVFGPKLTAVTRALGEVPALDLRAAADYLHFGMLFGTKTLAEGIHMVPAGSTLVFDWRDATIEMVENRRPASLFDPVEQDHATYLERVRAEFNHAVTRACSGEAPLGLSLSGGLDSRAILSAIDTRATSVRTYTVGVRFCADHVIGERLAQIGNTRHTFLELGDAYLKDFLPNMERMIALTDGMYLSHGLTEVLALEAVRQAGIRTLLRGHCGELAKASLAWPFHPDPAIIAMTTREEFAPYFFRRVNYVSRAVGVEDLFEPEHATVVRGAARQSLDEALQGVNLAPQDLCSYLYLTQHHRRFTLPSLELFRTEVDVLMPFADAQFLRALLSGPAQWRLNTDLHRYITGKNDDRLSRVRNSNTGAPGSAGPLLEKLLDPVNSVLKRLNVRGYRHYHHFDKWMRVQLLTSVEEILLDEMTSRRHLFRLATIRRLVDETRRGVADHAYLLQVLLVMELWQRQQSPVTPLVASA